MVTDAAAYPWSNYGANALGQTNRLVAEHEVYRGLGMTAQARQASYRALFTECLGEDMADAIHDATERGWVPGSEKFRRQIEEGLGRRVDRPVRGRPAKVDEGMKEEGQLSLL